MDDKPNRSDINSAIHRLLDLLMHLGIKDAGKNPFDFNQDTFFIDAHEINGFLNRRFGEKDGA